jgi:tetratricopeptide (TPR) repeat protein
MDRRFIVIASVGLLFLAAAYGLRERSHRAANEGDDTINLLAHPSGGALPAADPDGIRDVPKVVVELESDLTLDAQPIRTAAAEPLDKEISPPAAMDEGEPLEPAEPTHGNQRLTVPLTGDADDRSTAQQPRLHSASEPLTIVNGLIKPSPSLEPLTNIPESQTLFGPPLIHEAAAPAISEVAASSQAAAAAPPREEIATPAPTETREAEIADPASPLKTVPESVNRIARNHLQYGSSLARRGSLFSARQEFFSGLRLLVESLDLVNGGTAQREHYDMAMTALREAEDFMRGDQNGASISVARVVEIHQSKIIEVSAAETLTPLAAMQAYFSFAERHLAEACGRAPVASDLLFALGKLYTVKASHDASGESVDLAVAILMHQAALTVNPNNYLSANELGVSLAKLGHYEPARAALLHSVATRPTPEAWKNLAVVHRQLGETELADLASSEQMAAEQSSGQSSPIERQVRWVLPTDLSSAEQVSFTDPPAPSGPMAAAPAATRPEPVINATWWTKFKQTLGQQ